MVWFTSAAQYRRESGALICLDVKTGKELYYESIHEARYRASPVLGDGKIYLPPATAWSPWSRRGRSSRC